MSSKYMVDLFLGDSLKATPKELGYDDFGSQFYAVGDYITVDDCDDYRVYSLEFTTEEGVIAYCEYVGG